MNNKSFTTSLLVDATPDKVFNAINNARGWWSEDIEGSTDKLNAEFNYHYKDIHIAKMKVTELIQDKKVAWLVLENYFNFIKDQNEWKGTTIIFEISPKDKQTEIKFTHEGLVPEDECYNVCHDAWTSFINKSLRDLITKGKGQPNPKDKEGEINKVVTEKWNI
jgi:hypothetical protein